MAGRGNSYGNRRQTHSRFNGVGGRTGMGNNYSNAIGNPGSGSGSGAEVEHIPDVWTPEEQAILEEGLLMYASSSVVTRYARIAMRLPHKTVRDVALRAQWMNAGLMMRQDLLKLCEETLLSLERKETGKIRKEDNSKKIKNKREREKESSSKSTQLPSQSGVQSGPVSLDNDDDISYKAIGGPTAELLEQNAQFFRQISANFTSFQIQDNINLIRQARDNIIIIMNSCSTKDAPELMRQMPPIPVKLNQELLSAILP